MTGITVMAELTWMTEITRMRDVIRVTETQGAEELFVMASEAKTLQPIARVVSVYCRIDYELDLSNRLAIVLQTW